METSFIHGNNCIISFLFTNTTSSWHIRNITLLCEIFFAHFNDINRAFAVYWLKLMPIKNSGISLSCYIPHDLAWCNWKWSLLDRCSLICSSSNKNERSVYLSNWLTEIVNWISLIFWFLFTFHHHSQLM